MIFGQYVVVEMTCEIVRDGHDPFERRTPTHSYGPCTEDEAGDLIQRHKEMLVKRREAGEDISLSWVVLPMEAIEN